MFLYGFKGRAEAMRWEKIVKSRARGADNRAWAMLGIKWGVCPKYKNRKQYDVPVGLQVHINIPDHLKWGD